MHFEKKIGFHRKKLHLHFFTDNAVTISGAEILYLFRQSREVKSKLFSETYRAAAAHRYIKWQSCLTYVAIQNCFRFE